MELEETSGERQSAHQSHAASILHIHDALDAFKADVVW